MIVRVTIASAWAIAVLLPALPSAAQPDTRRIREGLSSSQLGLDIEHVSKDLRVFFGSKPDVGILVSGVKAKDTAAKAGVRVGDLLIEIDGKSLTSTDDLLLRLLGTRPGDTAKVKVLRNKRPRTLTLRIERPPVKSIEENRSDGFLEVFEFETGSDPFRTMGATSNSDVQKLLARIAALEKRIAVLEQRQTQSRRPKRSAPKAAVKKK